LRGGASRPPPPDGWLPHTGLGVTIVRSHLIMVRVARDLSPGPRPHGVEPAGFESRFPTR